MRSFSEVVWQILENGNPSIFYLVRIQFPSQTLQHTTLPYDVTVPSIGSFDGDSNLQSIEAPRLTSIVDRATYKVVYADPEFELKNLFELGATGSQVTIYMGFINTLDSAVLGAVPGAPILDPAAIIVAYSGIIDTHGYAITEDGESVATFECSSPMADLDQKTYFVTTDAELRKRAPNDSAFSMLHIGSESQTLKWGKK